MFVILGVVLLVGVRTQASLAAMAIGIAAAAGSAIFSTANGWIMQRTTDTAVVSIYELCAGSAWMTIGFMLVPHTWVAPQNVSSRDWLWLLLLAGVCTVLPWLWTLRVLRTVRARSLSRSRKSRLEPVYSLILAWCLFPGSERLSATFYAGTLLPMPPSLAANPNRAVQVISNRLDIILICP